MKEKNETNILRVIATIFLVAIIVLQIIEKIVSGVMFEANDNSFFSIFAAVLQSYSNLIQSTKAWATFLWLAFVSCLCYSIYKNETKKYLLMCISCFINIILAGGFSIEYVSYLKDTIKSDWEIITVLFGTLVILYLSTIVVRKNKEILSTFPKEYLANRNYLKVIDKSFESFDDEQLSETEDSSGSYLNENEVHTGDESKESILINTDTISSKDNDETFNQKDETETIEDSNSIENNAEIVLEHPIWCRIYDKRIFKAAKRKIIHKRQLQDYENDLEFGTYDTSNIIIYVFSFLIVLGIIGYVVFRGMQNNGSPDLLAQAFKSLINFVTQIGPGADQIGNDLYHAVLAIGIILLIPIVIILLTLTVFFLFRAIVHFVLHSKSLTPHISSFSKQIELFFFGTIRGVMFFLLFIPDFIATIFPTLFGNEIQDSFIEELNRNKNKKK